MQKSLWKSYPLFCLILAFVLVCGAGSAFLARARHTPEVTLTDLSGDAALLDGFGLTFWLYDPLQTSGPVLTRQYTLEDHALSARNAWTDAAAAPVPAPFDPPARELAAFERGDLRLTITTDPQALYHSPRGNSVSIALDAGYLLTVCDRDSGQTLYQGRLNTWGGDDVKPYFDAQPAPPDTPEGTFPLLWAPQRTLGNFALTGGAA